MVSGDALEIKSDLLLVHEGTADTKVLGALMRHHVITGYQTFPLKGQSKLRGYLKGLALSPHFRVPVPNYESPVRSLALVLDAENDANATFAGVRGALENAGLPAPDRPGGITEGMPRVGVFLVPDNLSPGKIETLCVGSVDNDPAWHCLDVFFGCFADRGGNLPSNMDKARAQAFLATRPQPDLPVGLAADEGYWNFQHQVFGPLTEFLRTLTS